MSTATMNGTATPPSLFAGKTTKAAGDYERPPSGSHMARLVVIHDLGTHDDDYNGEAKADVRKLFLAWELSSEMRNDGHPHMIGQEYNVSVEDDGSFLFGEKSNIRKMMESWRGEKYGPSIPVDLMTLLGRACLINITHKASGEKTYANVAAVSGVPKGTTVPKQHRPSVVYHISQGEPPDLDWLPRNFGRTLAEIVEDSKERTGKPIGRGGSRDTPYSEAAKPAATATGKAKDSDVPF